MEKKLEVKDLRISFKTNHGTVKAVRDISFTLNKGETLAIVGESGSGKSVTAKAILGILAGNSIVEGGEIIYEGKDLLKFKEEDFNRIRGNKITMIFQDPLSSLDPIMKIGRQMTEATLLNNKINQRNAKKAFSRKIKQLKAAMIASGCSKKDLTDQVNLFSRQMKEGSRLETAYHTAHDYAASSILNIDRILIRLRENDKSKSIASCHSLTRKLIKTAPLFITDTEIDTYQSYISFLKDVSSGYSDLQNEEYFQKFLSLKSFLIHKSEESEPDFFNTDDLFNNDFLKKIVEALKYTKEHSASDYKELTQEFPSSSTDFTSVAARMLLYLKEQAYMMSHKVSKQAAYDKAIKIMEDVGIKDPEKRFHQYPFEFSGGMRQRIVIAIALSANPDILICDEPTTALDVTIQAQILELINHLKRRRNLTVIFITHDLGVVANIADKVAVMYAGKIVEEGTVNDIFYQPAHPYTWALLTSMPDLDTKDKLEAIPGTPPNMIYPPVGDAFAARNKYAMQIDFERQPPFFQISETHRAASWLLHPSAPRVDIPKQIQDRIRRMKDTHNENQSGGEGDDRQK